MDLENLLKNASLGNVELSNQLCAYLWDRKYTYAESENESIPTIDDSGELMENLFFSLEPIDER